MVVTGQRDLPPPASGKIDMRSVMTMTKRKTTEVRIPVTRHEVWEDDKRTINTGDDIKVRLPGVRGRKLVTFSAYVVPDRGVPYIEVIDGQGLSRCIRPDAIEARKRKQRGSRK